MPEYDFLFCGYILFSGAMQSVSRSSRRNKTACPGANISIGQTIKCQPKVYKSNKPANRLFTGL
jgi:hypothetical protein